MGIGFLELVLIIGLLVFISLAWLLLSRRQLMGLMLLTFSLGAIGLGLATLWTFREVSRHPGQHFVNHDSTGQQFVYHQLRTSPLPTPPSSLRALDEVDAMLRREHPAAQEATAATPVQLSEIQQHTDLSMITVDDLLTAERQADESVRQNVDETDLASSEARPGMDHVQNAPEWVNARPTEAEDGNLAIVLYTDYLDSRFACDRQIRELTLIAIREYAQQLAESHGLPRLDPEAITLGTDQLKALARERHYERRTFSLGEMTRLYQFTVIDEAMNEQLLRQMEQSFVSRRVRQAGWLSGGMVTMVAGLFGAFRFASRNASDPLLLD